MSKQTGARRVAEKSRHWTLTTRLAANGQAVDASTIVPGWLPRVEPELVRSSDANSPTVTTDPLPRVDAELVRSAKQDSFPPMTDALHTEEPEVINGSTRDLHPVALEALSPAEPETVSSSNEESTAVAADLLPSVESVAVTNSNGESPAVATDPLPPAEPELICTSIGDSSPAGIGLLPPAAPDLVNSSNGSLSPAKSTPFPPTEPGSQSSIAQPAVQQIPAPTSELSTAKPFKASRKAECPNGFRHLTLLAREESRLVFPTEPNGLAAEQFRLLRRTLSKEFETGAVLLITSPAMGDGKTLTSINLASCLAEAGQPTLLLEADIRRPTIRLILSGGIESPGVEDVLARKVEPPRAVHGVKELSLYAAMVARIPENPAQLIGGSGVKHFLAWARENFLWVVLDGPPVLPAADVPELLPFVDAALLVVRAQSTPRELAKQAIDILGKHLRGVVFNEVTVASNPHYRYINNYYYPHKSDSKSVGADSVKRSESA